MSSIDSMIGKEHRDFINGVLDELNSMGIKCGWTEYPTPRDAQGILWAAHVIAQRKEGWQGYLPLGWKYNTSKEGILFRMYDALHGATENPTIRKVIEGRANQYFEAVRNIAQSQSQELRSDQYVIGVNTMHGEKVVPQTLFM